MLNLREATVLGVLVLVLAAPAQASEPASVHQINSAPSSVPSTGWTLMFPKDALVNYMGEVNYDQAGLGPGAVLYSAPNAAGLIGAVIAHGLIVDSAKSKQKTKLREQADRVLLPYKPVLDVFTHKELFSRALPKLRISSQPKMVDYAEGFKVRGLIESVPTFSMTQDQKAIVLSNTITMHLSAGTDDSKAESKEFTVVSDPLHAAHLTESRMANAGESLKEESARMLAESIEMAQRALSDEWNKVEKPHKSYRYLVGGEERVERGQLVQERCGRAVIKTLRGNFMSIPYSSNCEVVAGQRK